MQSLNLKTNEELMLGARLYPCGGERKGAVLIGGAMGVPQDYYAPFAEWLATQGFE